MFALKLYKECVSCHARAIAPATVPSLSQRIGVCGSGAHEQPYYVSGSKCYNLFVLASVVGIWKGMNESRCFSVCVCLGRGVVLMHDIVYSYVQPPG